MIQTEIETHISDAVAEQLIFDLVSIASPSHHEHDASQFLVNWMQNYGYDEAYVDEVGNAVGIIGNGEHDLILLGHIDTFAGNPPVFIENRTLFGRGSVDAKGSLCTFAVSALRAELLDNIRLIVVGAVEEEAATSRGARHIASHFQPDACIIGEPSHWDRMTLGYKGRLLIDWRWEGALAHSAGEVPSPAEQAIAYWNQVLACTQSINTDKNSIFGRLDASLRDINTHQAGVNGIAEMTIGFRLPPDVSPEQILETISPQNQATISHRGAEQAWVADKNSDLCRAFRGAIREQDGKPRFVHKTGTSDMNVVAPIWNCPILAYGPGDSLFDHTPNEQLNLDEYNRAIRVLTNALERYAEGFS